MEILFFDRSDRSDLTDQTDYFNQTSVPSVTPSFSVAWIWVRSCSGEIFLESRSW